MFFQHENRFRSSFSILFNFQGPVRLSLLADDLIILSQKRLFVKHFFQKLFGFCELVVSLFSVLTLVLSFRFRCLSEVILSGGPWRSSIIPYSCALVNTFLQIFLFFLPLEHFRQFFSSFRPLFDSSFPYYIGMPRKAFCSRGIDQFLSSCFIWCSVSPTASASMGSTEIKPMGMGPSTL